MTPFGIKRSLQDFVQSLKAAHLLWFPVSAHRGAPVMPPGVELNWLLPESSLRSPFRLGLQVGRFLIPARKFGL